MDTPSTRPATPPSGKFNPPVTPAGGGDLRAELAITTERVRLAPFSPGDGGEHFDALVSDPQVARWLPGARPGTRALAAALTADFAAHWDRLGYGGFAVRDRGTDQFLGRCGLRYLPELDDVELLYAFAPAVWGRGLATEAARAAVRDGFDRVGLRTVIGLVLPENIASRRVLERVGMTADDGLVDIFGLRVVRLHVTRET